MKWRLPQYSGKDYLVLTVFLIPFTLVMNSVIFGMRIFSDPIFLLKATLITGVAFCIDFICCGAVAVLLKKRFPKDEQTGERMGYMILVFLLMTGLFLMLLFRGYELIDFYGYKYNETGFIWAYIGMGIANIFLTFLHEGIARYENWKSSLKETEALKKVYRQGRLLCLKSQINPHFLFNSLNSLSSLIHEDEKKGEKFLDEMSKVYRYMLYNDDEHLVSLETELKFIDSYLYLLQTRHTEALKVNMDIREDMKNKWIPPMALQTVIESVVSQNTICKDCPLEISIGTDTGNNLVVRNNMLARVTSDDTPEDNSGMENLVKKYALLNQSAVITEHTLSEQVTRIPLIENKEEVLV